MIPGEITAKTHNYAKKLCFSGTPGLSETSVCWMQLDAKKKHGKRGDLAENGTSAQLGPKLTAARIRRFYINSPMPPLFYEIGAACGI